ncbi:MAG: redoxin domain-containing protein [Leptospiraceae bacterium]|nr:redoxin domain-containing protein [Leptospiraceae bacterium]
MLKIFLLFLFLIIPNFGEDVHNLPVYDLQDERFTIHQEIETHKDKKLLLINFTNSNCKPCKLEIPKLIEMKEKYNSAGLVLWIVFVGDSSEIIMKMKKDLSIKDDIKVFKDPLEISYKRMNFSGVPTNFLIDNTKNIIYKSSGFTDAKMRTLENKISNNLKK